MNIVKPSCEKRSLIIQLLVVALSMPLISHAQNKVVVVPLFGEPAKATIYTEVAARCFTLDDLDDQGSSFSLAQLTKQRADSVIEVTWSPVVEVSNLFSFNTRQVDIEILVNGQAADFQTGGVFRAVDETLTNTTPFTGTSIHTIHTDIAAGSYTLAYQIKSSAQTPSNIVRSCNEGSLIVKEIGG